MRVFGSSTLQPVPGATYGMPLSSGYRVNVGTRGRKVNIQMVESKKKVPMFYSKKSEINRL